MRVERFAVPVGADESDSAAGLTGARYSFDGRPGPRLLATACVHGDEVTSTGALWYVAEQLAGQPFGGSVTLIPCVNALATAASQRQVPLEGADLNRRFPGRQDGTLADRLAAALVGLLDAHDALIDVHTAGWCVPFVLLDHFADAGLQGRTSRWAAASGLPVIGEMPAAQSDLQGLDRSWSAWAVRLGKPAVTMELSGFHTLESEAAQRGAAAVLAMIGAAPALLRDGGTAAPVPLRRAAIHAESGGLFEAMRRPGERVEAGDRLGLVRSLQGEVRSTVTAGEAGLIIALQPVSAVHVGSWLATLAVEGR